MMTMIPEDQEEILEAIEMIKEDQDASKKLKESLDRIASLLKADDSLKVEKAVLELEEINSQGVSSYIRTQLWDLISKLESINASS